MDDRALIGARPLGTRRQVILGALVSSEQPVPQHFGDTLWVVFPADPNNAWPLTDWPQSHGSTLPTAGSVVTVAIDDQGELQCVGWHQPPLDPTGQADDTAGILARLQTGSCRLTDGTYLINSLLQVPANTSFTGTGSTRVTLLLGPNGAVRWGPAIGTLPQQQGGVQGGMTIIGNGAAGASSPLCVVNCTGGAFTDLAVTGSLGDGFVWAGQNCTFVSLNTGGHQGCAYVEDNGCGGGVFIKPEFAFAAGWHMEIRETVAPPGGAYPIPTNNYFYGGICEQGWPISTPANLGCVHYLASSVHRFSDFNFYSGAGASSLCYSEPNTTPGRSGDRNDLQFYRDCYWTGSPGTTSAVSCSATYNTIVGLQADGVVFQGHNLMSSFTNGVLWNGSMAVRDEGSIQCFNVTNPYKSGGGTPMRRPKDREQAQNGVRAPSEPGWSPSAVTLAADTGYFSRLVPSRDMFISGIAFNLEAAGGTGDQIDGGIFLEYNTRIAAAGISTSLSVPGRTVLTFPTPVQILAGWVYYACLATGTITGTPQVTFATSNAANLFGATAGASMFVGMTPLTGAGCPAAMAAGGGASLTYPTSGPAVVLLEAGTLGQ